MKKNGNSLSAVQSRAIVCLIEEENVAEAAREAGVSRTTIYSWMKNPRFASELETARRAEHQARLNMLRELLPSALVTMEALLLSPREHVRLKAASEIIKAYMALASKEPSPALALDITDEEWSEETVPALAQKCMEGFLNGSLDSRTVQMGPQYFSMVERAMKEKAARRAEPDEQPEEVEETSELQEELTPAPAECEYMGPPEDNGFETIRANLRGIIEATNRRWAGS